MGELRGMDELWLSRSAYRSEGLMKLAKWIKKILGFDSLGSCIPLSMMSQFA